MVACLHRRHFPGFDLASFNKFKVLLVCHWSYCRAALDASWSDVDSLPSTLHSQNLEFLCA